MSNNVFTPANIDDLLKARDVAANIFDNIEFMPADFEMYPFMFASYISLCKGCTDPRAVNYDPTAEVDDNTCL
jgi:hypothetical protein